eukprot:5757403-Pyramimonas_sp.AAC.1
MPTLPVSDWSVGIVGYTWSPPAHLWHIVVAARIRNRRREKNCGVRAAWIVRRDGYVALRKDRKTISAAAKIGRLPSHDRSPPQEYAASPHAIGPHRRNMPPPLASPSQEYAASPRVIGPRRVAEGKNWSSTTTRVLCVVRVALGFAPDPGHTKIRRPKADQDDSIRTLESGRFKGRPWLCTVLESHPIPETDYTRPPAATRPPYLKRLWKLTLRILRAPGALEPSRTVLQGSSGNGVAVVGGVKLAGGGGASERARSDGTPPRRPCGGD